MAGGKRAKGRRGDQDPELDNTAWLAELERAAATQADDDDEDDWASTLRGRRSPNPPASDPGWVPSNPPPSPPPDHRHLDPDPAAAGPAYGPGDGSTYGLGGGSEYGSGDDSAYGPEGGSAYGPGSGLGDRSSVWSAAPSTSDPMPPPPSPMPPPPEPIPAPPDPIPAPPDPMPTPPDPIPGPDWSWRPQATDGDGEPATHLDPDATGFGEPRRDPGAGGDWGGVTGDPGDGGWRPAGVDAPTGTWSPAEPVGREPDYPALFGELYRRSAAQQDPIWEDAPDHPLPEHGPPDPPPTVWPFEETTQSWEPSDRSFIWPADELPSTSAEWDQPTPGTWLDDPQPPTASTPAPPPIAETGPPLAPLPSAPARPPPAPAAGPPPADWAAAIPADVPAARRAPDPAATRMWRPEEAEPGVPLGEASWPEEGRGPGTRPPGTRAARADAIPADEPGEVRRAAPAKAVRTRPAGGERRPRAWPRIVAVISWIVLVMVVCWFYVFPWLERVLPENF
jgi:hypothetical protein